MYDQNQFVVVIILNWGDPVTTIKCIEAVERQDWVNYELIVVDNGSDEEGFAILQSRCKNYTLIRNEKNIGFTGGMNVGINKAREMCADYVWLLNNDAVPEIDALKKIVALSESDRDIGLCSPIICDHPGGRVNYAGGVWDSYSLSFRWTNDIHQYQQWVKEYPDRIWLFGTALLIKKNVIQKIGCFNEKYFAYGEDNDYSARAIKHGIKCRVSTDAIVYHKTWRKNKPSYYYYYNSRSQIFNILQHCNTSLLKELKLLFWSICSLNAMIKDDELDSKRTQAIKMGISHGFLGRGGAYTGKMDSSILISVVLMYSFRVLRYLLK